MLIFLGINNYLFLEYLDGNCIARDLEVSSDSGLGQYSVMVMAWVLESVGGHNMARDLDMILEDNLSQR